MYLTLLLFLVILIVPILIEIGLIFGFRRHRKKFARNGSLCLAVMLVPIVLCTTTVTIPSIYNQIRLIKFARQLYDYPLPPQTLEMNREASVYVGGGSANKCWYHARRTLQTQLSHDEIETYYEGVQFNGIGDSSTALAIAGLDGKLGVGVGFDEVDPSIVTIGTVDGPYFGSFITIDPRCFQ